MEKMWQIGIRDENWRHNGEERDFLCAVCRCARYLWPLAMTRDYDAMEKRDFPNVPNDLFLLRAIFAPHFSIWPNGGRKHGKMY
jgi:hypothetical protein